MIKKVLARDLLWDIAEQQRGYVAAWQAENEGLTRKALQMLVHRGTLERVAHGVYRFPKFPQGDRDDLALGVLWTRAPEAVLSHETALEAYGISDVNPNCIHLTVAKKRRIRRAGGESYSIHYDDLTPEDCGWWNEIPIVTPVKAIRQCMDYGTPTYLVRQAIERAHSQGYIKGSDRERLKEMLEVRHEK